jgi:hypothetical protein
MVQGPPRQGPNDPVVSPARPGPGSVRAMPSGAAGLLGSAGRRPHRRLMLPSASPVRMLWAGSRAAAGDPYKAADRQGGSKQDGRHGLQHSTEANDRTQGPPRRRSERPSAMLAEVRIPAPHGELPAPGYPLRAEPWPPVGVNRDFFGAGCADREGGWLSGPPGRSTRPVRRAGPRLAVVRRRDAPGPCRHRRSRPAR